MFWNKKKPEEQRSFENPAVPITADNLSALLGEWNSTASGQVVTLDNALELPAVLCAVNFLSATIASLPLHVYEKTEDGRKRTTKPIENILSKATNEETTSFDWRKYSYTRVFTGGRSLTFIERNTVGRIINLWPLDPSKVQIQRRNGRKIYKYTEVNSGMSKAPVTYTASEIIDVSYNLESDMLTTISPVLKGKEAIGLGLASTKYGAKLFQNGGVPPFVMTGKFTSGAGLKRAAADVNAALKETANKVRQVLTLPENHDIKTLGIDPEKMQAVELKRYIVEEIARIYNLPPSFLQDLTNGTFSNVEQQDLHLVKHTIRHWVTQLEQELNLKLFGRNNNKMYAEFNLDGLLRGDFVTRMAGYASGIQNAVLVPNEARELENRAAKEGGDELLIQGATVPLGSQPTQTGGEDA